MTSLLGQTLLVLPAFNEEESVAAVISEIRSVLGDVSLVVVDDGSHDGTADRARRAGAAVLSLPFNLGVGGAMRAGFRYAIANGYTNVVQIDSDGQHDPKNVPALVEALEDCDLVLGARFAGTGDYQVRGPRRWAMVVLAYILSRVARTKLTDATSGFRASGPKAVRLFATHYPAEYLGDTIESLVIASREGYRVRQIPVSMRARAGGRPSHNPLRAAIYLGRAMMALIFALVRPAHTFRLEG